MDVAQVVYGVNGQHHLGNVEPAKFHIEKNHNELSYFRVVPTDVHLPPGRIQNFKQDPDPPPEKIIPVADSSGSEMNLK